MGLGDLIEVNDFAFCRDHGFEYCGRCFCDYRNVNNYGIEENPAIMDLSEQSFYFNIDNRRPISIFEMGATPSRRQNGKYECITHKNVDCKDCFNLVKLVCAEAKEAERTEAWLKKREKWANKVEA